MKRENIYREYLEIIKDFKRYLESLSTRKSDRESPGSPLTSLEKLSRKVEECTSCPLFKTRTNPVFGEGSVSATVMFVGEAPGRDEDLQGRPFVGAAGRLLRESIKELGISPEEFYIANILKCRPPGNRDPQPEEIARCLPYLREQINIINPRIICTLGKFSTQSLLGTSKGITGLRGKKFFTGKYLIIPTYHPAACIYRPALREKFLKDLKMLKEEFIRLKNLSS